MIEFGGVIADYNNSPQPSKSDVDHADYLPEDNRLILADNFDKF
ncbi:MAG: hypothetical protein P5697_05130 [Limnospira sp. PMC 1256.20]|nr:hypothetical protein [Limnospira sp. PMC 1256.20]EKD05831.1 hypothetical protein SPLC1_S590490 [Arthrospira platensis C1]MDT9176983.1 hypothetical protein [Limnospira sp. PMC 1238.20]MDT9227524.1 hypothetical protein [Limnospira sp. PMC 1242.20]MDT9258549.1 hypothetical protein [Limnospira sp. PMC 1236.20]MDT9212851.1 hypothetical protein [Limnospira sp. PMC 1256.20]